MCVCVCVCAFNEFDIHLEFSCGLVSDKPVSFIGVRNHIKKRIQNVYFDGKLLEVRWNTIFRLDTTPFG